MRELMKVLLIDDDEDIRRLGQLSLEDIGQFETTIAASAREGIELAVGSLPDVILLDVMMPGMDGFAALEELRSRPELKDIPVIFLTASVRHDDVESFRRRGALGVIPKPFDPMTLPAQVRELTGAVDQ